jgi:hypothetical protein
MSRLIELVKEGASIEKVEAELYRPCFVGYIDAQDKNGRTALMYAALRGDADMVRLLLRFGADGYIRSTVDGATAYLCAIQSEHTEVATILANYRSPQPQSAPLEPAPKSNPTTEFISIAERVIGDYYLGLPTEATEENCESIKWLTLEVFKELFLKELKKDATAGIYVDFIPKWVNFISHDLDIAALRTLLMLGDGEYLCMENGVAVSTGNENVWIYHAIAPKNNCIELYHLIEGAWEIDFKRVKELLIAHYMDKFAINSFEQIHISNEIQYERYSISGFELSKEIIKRVKEKYNIELQEKTDRYSTSLINSNYIAPTKEESPAEPPTIQSAPKKGFFDFLKRK